MAEIDKIKFSFHPYKKIGCYFARMKKQYLSIIESSGEYLQNQIYVISNKVHAIL